MVVDGQLKCFRKCDVLWEGQSMEQRPCNSRVGREAVRGHDLPLLQRNKEWTPCWYRANNSFSFFYFSSIFWASRRRLLSFLNKNFLCLSCSGVGPLTGRRRRRRRRHFRACGLGSFGCWTLSPVGPSDEGPDFAAALTFSSSCLFFFLLSSSPMISFGDIFSTSSPSSPVSSSLGSFNLPRSGRWRLGSKILGISPNQSSKTYSSHCSGGSTTTVGISLCLIKPWYVDVYSSMASASLSPSGNTKIADSRLGWSLHLLNKARLSFDVSVGYHKSDVRNRNEYNKNDPQ